MIYRLLDRGTFAEKRDVIAAAEELLGQNEAQLAELVEEQADNYLDEDNFPDSKMTDANVKKRIKALDKRTDAEEIAVLQKYLDLKGDISLFLDNQALDFCLGQIGILDYQSSKQVILTFFNQFLIE